MRLGHDYVLGRLVDGEEMQRIHQVLPTLVILGEVLLLVMSGIQETVSRPEGWLRGRRCFWVKAAGWRVDLGIVSPGQTLPSFCT
jgi:hypothetical protein